MKHIQNTQNLNLQHGAATLITSLVLLVAMTIITIFAARSAVMEQKIFANEYRAKQAFEAAEAGLQVGKAYVISKDGADKNYDDTIDTVTSTTKVSLSNGAKYTVALNDLSGGLFSEIEVVATGESDDGTAAASVREVVGYVPAFPNVPGNPLISKGAVVLNGTGDVINPESNSTIWTGSNSLTFAGSGGTQIPDPSNPSNLIVSADSTNPNAVDVVTGDTTLSSMTDPQFFENFMGNDYSTYYNGASVREVDYAAVNNSHIHGTNPGTDLARREIIWVRDVGSADAIGAGTQTISYSGNTTVGCLDSLSGSATCAANRIKPVVLVLDGDLAGNGTVKIYGVVYITGDFSGSGNLEVEGAVIMEGDVTGSGTVNVTYNSTVLGKLQETVGAAASLPGSWRDF